MKIALDVTVRDGKPSSFTRISHLHEEALQSIGMDPILWTGGPCKADILWSPWMHVSENWAGQGIGILHDVSPLLLDNRPGWKQWLRGKKFRRKLRQAVRTNAAFASVSLDAEMRFRAHFPTVAIKTQHVPHFVSSRLTQFAERDPAPVLRKLQLKPEFVLFVGAFRMHKNWMGLMNAWKSLVLSGRVSVPLVIAGETHRAGKELKRIQKEAWFLKTTHFLGAQGDENLSALYQSCSCLVFPSFNEGFGLPPLEAMAFGAPVAASRVTAIPEVLGHAAEYFDPFNHCEIADAIARIVDQPYRNEKLVKDSIAQADVYSAERTGRAMLDLSQWVNRRRS